MAGRNYIQCKCSELGPLDVTLAGLLRRIEASSEYDLYYSTLETIDSPIQMALRQCRGCKKYYQESLCGQGFNTMRYLYEIPPIEKADWVLGPFEDPFACIVSSTEARNAGL